MSAKRDYYQVLEVERGASADDLKKSYRKLAVKYHPDKNPGDKASEEKFKELGEAYEALSDPQKRGAYDQFGHAAFDPRMRAGGGGQRGSTGGFHDPFDIFREVFAGGGGGGGGGGGSIFEELFGEQQQRSPTGPRRGSDLRYDLELDFEEAVLGCEKEINISKLDQCETCHGGGGEKGSSVKPCGTCGGRGQIIRSKGIFSVAQTCPDCDGAGRKIDKPCRACRGAGRRERASKIKLKIPPGVDNGARLRSAGNGESGTRGGPAGDLYVVLHVREHGLFSRDGDDLICEVPISFTQATLGADVDVPTMAGSSTVRLPSGTQHGTVFRIRGKGVQNIQGHGIGDLLVRVQIEVPTKLNAEQRAKLVEFAELCKDDNVHGDAGFFTKAKGFFKKGE
jgi:molecular chaperone DnaJ